MKVSLEHGGFGSHPKENETGSFCCCFWSWGAEGERGRGESKHSYLILMTHDFFSFFFFNPVAWQVQKSLIRDGKTYI